MSDAIKVLAPLVSVTTGNNVGSARLVRAYASANTLVTVTDAADVTIGTFVMPGGSVEVIYKGADEKIVANVALSCSAIGYR